MIRIGSSGVSPNCMLPYDINLLAIILVIPARTPELSFFFPLHPPGFSYRQLSFLRIHHYQAYMAAYSLLFIL